MKRTAELMSEDPTQIYCIGESTNILKFEIGNMEWLKIPMQNDKQSLEAFDGTLRYSSSCFVPPCPEEKIIVTGGCCSINGFPSSAVAEFRIKSLTEPKKKRSMLLKRYGHLSVFLNGLVYCIGGFSHKDLPSEQPVTLSACERFSVTAECQWSYISSMLDGRAFASQVTFNA